MKKIILKNMMYSFVVVATTSTMVAMDRSTAGTPTSASNASMSVIVESTVWGGSTTAIELCNAEISKLERQIEEEKNKFFICNESTQQALRDVASPPRERGVAEPALLKKGIFGYGEAAMESLRSWTLYLTGNKAYWKKQYGTILGYYDQRGTLANKIFMLDAKLVQIIKEREALKETYLKTEVATLQGKLAGRNLAIRNVARTAGFEVQSTASISTIDQAALQRKVEEAQKAQEQRKTNDEPKPEEF